MARSSSEMPQDCRPTVLGAGLGLLVFAGAVLAQTSPAERTPPPKVHLYRIWGNQTGETHSEEVPMGTGLAQIPGITMVFNPAGFGAGRGQAKGPDGRNRSRTPARQFSVTMAGSIDVALGDGSKIHLNTGDILFEDDQGSKGHIATFHGALVLSLRVPDDFNVRTWAKGEKI